MNLLPLLVFLSSHMAASTRRYTFTKKCNKPPSSEVVWTITLENIENIKKQEIVMQTRDFHSQDIDSSWKDLQNCTRNIVQAGKYSIQCEIDSNMIRMRYHLRVIREKFPTQKPTARISTEQVPKNLTEKPYEVLVSPTSDGHYQDGLYCYPAHGIRNLRAFNVTPASMKIGWTLFPWDLALIRSMEIKVSEGGGNILVHLVLQTGPSMPEHQEHLIRGLECCKEYTVIVYYDYSFLDRRTERMHTSTRCDGKVETTTTTTNVISPGEVVIIVLCSLLLTLGALLLIQQSRHHQLQQQRNASVVIVELNEQFLAK